MSLIFLLLLLNPQVTVWAVEQEDPVKTLDKWTRIATPEAATSAVTTARQEACTVPAAGAASGQGEGAEEEYDPRASHPLHGKQAASQPRQDTPQLQPTAAPSDGSSCSSSRSQAHAQAQAAGPEDSSTGTQGPGLKGADYMVPWHLPFHRAGVAAAVQMASSGSSKAGAGASGADQQDPPGPDARSGSASRSRSPGGHRSQEPHHVQVGGGALTATPTPAAVDAAKGTVVFQRYYHLFERGELDGLVQQVPGVRLVDSFYDRSNWCVVFERVEE